MNEWEEFIASGIFELYVLELTTAEENAEVRRMLVLYPEQINREIQEICNVHEGIATANAIEPDPIIRPFLFAKIDFMDRMMAGEVPSEPLELSAASKISDYNQWLNRPDMVLPVDAADVYAKIIGYTPAITTAIVWIKIIAPQEVHDDEYERFLIIEGTCDIGVGEKIYSLTAGDYFQIPLHENHTVSVTSIEPCKVILQRVAA
jgi:mannose-6-phosphate isomerase-like protein (cupin superfamily)